MKIGDRVRCKCCGDIGKLGLPLVDLVSGEYCAQVHWLPTMRDPDSSITVTYLHKLEVLIP